MFGVELGMFRSSLLGNIRTLTQKSTDFLPEKRRISIHYSSAISLALVEQVEDSYSISGSDEDNSKRSISPAVRRSTLFSLVGKVVKTLDWRFVRGMAFSRVVGVFGLPHAMELFTVLSEIFLSAEMHAEFRRIVRRILSYDKSVNFHLFRLLDGLEKSLNAASLVPAFEFVMVSFAECLMLEDAMVTFLLDRTSGVERHFVMQFLAQDFSEKEAARLYEKLVL